MYKIIFIALACYSLTNSALLAGEFTKKHAEPSMEIFTMYGAVGATATGVAAITPGSVPVMLTIGGVLVGVLTIGGVVSTVYGALKAEVVLNMLEETERTGEISLPLRAVLTDLQNQAMEKYSLEVSDDTLIEALESSLQ